MLAIKKIWPPRRYIVILVELKFGGLLKIKKLIHHQIFQNYGASFWSTCGYVYMHVTREKFQNLWCILWYCWLHLDLIEHARVHVYMCIR